MSSVSDVRPVSAERPTVLRVSRRRRRCWHPLSTHTVISLTNSTDVGWLSVDHGEAVEGLSKIDTLGKSYVVSKQFGFRCEILRTL